MIKRLTERFDEALVFAARLHADDIRKGTTTSPRGGRPPLSREERRSRARDRKRRERAAKKARSTVASEAELRARLTRP